MLRFSLLCLCLSACAHPAGRVAEGTPDAVNLVKARQSGATQQFTWNAWSKETFARARLEKKFLLVDGAAEWCHWCHVMDETTYRDTRVAELINARFIAVRVDVDQRPDLADRYGDWGWPATVLLTPDAEEIGKFRGYIATEKMIELLGAVDAARVEPLPNDANVLDLPAAIAHAKERLDFFWDERDGSWGIRRKVPIGMNVVWELTGGSRARGEFTLSHQRELIDPVWGGIYQYSAAEDWKSPHFEKLITYQGPNLEAYALGYALTSNPQHLADAQAIAKYLLIFLRSDDGVFFVNQDADLNAHERDKPFVDGHTFYALNDAQRRALGIPWIDRHVYARENGVAISGLVALFKASGDLQALEAARKAADAVLKTHVLDDATVKREAATKAGPWYLADSAGFGLALAQLGAATGQARYSDAARKIAATMVVHLSAPDGALFDHTEDPDAAGVFARRLESFGHNVTAARLLAVVGEKERARRVLAAISGKIDNEGAWVGEFLLAANDSR